MIQTTKQAAWKDENGTSVPVNRLTKGEKLREKSAYQLVKQALDLNDRLEAFKVTIREYCLEVERMAALEMTVNREAMKGNITWFNFDRSIKVERAISEPMSFDDMTITAAKAKLDEFLVQVIESKFDFAKEMIISAFETTKGKLDPKKITPLTRYEKRVNHPLFSEACRLIQAAIRRPDSKTYYRVWQKDDEGKYKAIELNFSNI
jgi:hypothetical protein